MSNFSILFFIFGCCVLVTGLYMYTGHKIDLFTLRPAFKNLKISEWKNIGKWTIISSIIIIFIAIIGVVFHFE